MTSADLANLSAIEARDRMAAGDLTAEAYVQACLDRIAERDGAIEAWAYLDPGHALAQARALDQARSKGASPGPLFGLPVGIKDIIDTADMPTQNGSPIFTKHQPTVDAVCVAALRAAGAVIMGKTVTTELANVSPGKTRNPHNPAHTPGGSSSGSAAGVASGMIPLALGTQTGGSVIRPASFCGIHALKPTLGLISRTGVTLQSHTLDTVGVYGRSVADLGLIADALSGHDPSDSVSYPRTAPRLLEAIKAPRGVSPRLAFVRTPAWPEADAAARAAIEAFVRPLGSKVDTIELPALDGIIGHHAAVMGSENAYYYGPLKERHPDGVSTALSARLEAGARTAGRDYVAAIAARETIYADVARVLDRYAALIALPSCGPAPETLASTGNAVFNAMWTLLGVPCVNLPLLEVGGLPLGVQLIGKRREDGRLLATALAVEAWVKGA